MTRCFILALTLVVAGCGDVPLTEAEKLEAAKKCTDAGMIPQLWRSSAMCIVPRAAR